MKNKTKEEEGGGEEDEEEDEEKKDEEGRRKKKRRRRRSWSRTWKLNEVVYNTKNLAQNYLNCYLLNPWFHCLFLLFPSVLASLPISSSFICLLIPSCLPLLSPSLKKKKSTKNQTKTKQKNKKQKPQFHFLDFARLLSSALNKPEISPFTG